MKALVIIDVQKDYFPGGACVLDRPEEALVKIRELEDCFRRKSLPIFYVQHIAGESAAFFARGTAGADIHPALKPLAGEIIVKHRPNSFFETELKQKLSEAGSSELVICGMMTHMCVDTTVRCAKDLGYRTWLISDGCTTKDLTWEGRSVSAADVQTAYMSALQSFASVETCETFLNHF